VSPDQCRQARYTLKWTRGELAGAAGVTPWVVAAFEEEREVSPADEAAIRAALEAVGIKLFIRDRQWSRSGGGRYLFASRSK
jgi:DNA-binding XRE family transcriptional regulator